MLAYACIVLVFENGHAKKTQLNSMKQAEFKHFFCSLFFSDVNEPDGDAKLSAVITIKPN